MSLTWHDLICRIDNLVEMADVNNKGIPMQAPLPSDITDFGLHSDQQSEERMFNEIYGDTISKNYKETVDKMINTIEAAVKTGCSPMQFQSEVIILHLAVQTKIITISYVVTRPCALRCGFYKYVLWALTRFVLKYNLKMLQLTDCVMLNVKILKKWGFLQDSDSDGDPTMHITKNLLQSVKEEHWNMKSVYWPPAEKLMDQQFVNRFNIPALVNSPPPGQNSGP